MNEEDKIRGLRPHFLLHFLLLTRWIAAIFWLLFISIGLADAEPLRLKQGSDRMTVTYSNNLEKVQYLLAIESRFSPYFNKLICNTDILLHLRSLLHSPNVFLWPDIVENLPPEYQLPFTATEFDSAIRNGHMDKLRLAQDIINFVERACPERLAKLQLPVADLNEALRNFLVVMFDRLQQQSKLELKVKEEQDRMRILTQRFYLLPDLLGIARAKNAKDIYAEQKSQAAQMEKNKTPYRL